MRKLLPLMAIPALLLSSCSAPASEIEPGSSASTVEGQGAITGPNHPAEQGAEKETSQEIAATYDGTPLGYLNVVGFKPTMETGMGYWQGEWDQRGYHGLAATDGGGFPYQLGGELGIKESTLEFSKNTGPFIIRYMCQGSGKVDVDITAGHYAPISSRVQCQDEPKPTEIKLPEKNIESMRITQTPQPGTKAIYEVQVISKERQIP